MRPSKKKALRFALICVTAGLLISFIALASLNFSFFEMGTMEHAANTYTVTDSFTNIKVWGAECDVRLIPSEDGTCTVLCSETDRVTHNVSVKNGTLTIERTDDRKWYEHIGFTWSYWGPMEVVISLPERAYGDLDVRTASGKVEIPGDFSFGSAKVDGTSGDVRFTAAVDGELRLKTVSGDIQASGMRPETLTITSTSGDITLDTIAVGAAFACKTVSGSQTVTDLTCRSAALNTTSGDVTVSDLIASEDIRMEAVSGTLSLTRCDADTLWLKTTSGDVNGTLRTEKTFVTHTTSGSVRVPGSTSGGSCEVKTVSGDIRFDIADQ